MIKHVSYYDRLLHPSAKTGAGGTTTEMPPRRKCRLQPPKIKRGAQEGAHRSLTWRASGTHSLVTLTCDQPPSRALIEHILGGWNDLKPHNMLTSRIISNEILLILPFLGLQKLFLL